MFKRKKRETPFVKPEVNISRQTYIEGLPDMDWGAPDPIIQAGEHHLLIAYYLSDLLDGPDDTTIHVRDVEQDVAKMALFRMDGVRSFSQTTNIANHGCAYLDYGNGQHVGSHDVWEMKGSSKSFPLFNSEKREDFKHLIFAFHDTSVECFCRSYEFEIRVASSSTVFRS